MTRRLLNLLTVLSLLLCVAVAVLWVRSHAWNDTVGWYFNRWDGTSHVGGAHVGLSSDSGGLLLFSLRRRAHFQPDDPELIRYKEMNPELSRPHYRRDATAGYPYMGPEYGGWGLLGFGYYAGNRNPPLRHLSHDDGFVVVPYWFLASVTALLPVVRGARGWRTRRRAQSRLCLRCGYDLRASPGRCPECGTEPPSAFARE